VTRDQPGAGMASSTVTVGASCSDELARDATSRPPDDNRIPAWLAAARVRLARSTRPDQPAVPQSLSVSAGELRQDIDAD